MIKRPSVLLCAAFFLAPICASAAITVTQYNFEFDNAELEIVPDQIFLEDVAPRDNYPSASIRNLLHHDYYAECGGESRIGFVRHRYTETLCHYFFRAADIGDFDPALGDYYAVENHGIVYWMGDNLLVDGATWGSDNYVLMRDLETNKFIAVLQFNFDETTGLATLLASAIDLDGLTYTQGLQAITAAAIPEPSSFAALAAAATLGFVVTSRRRRRV